MTDLAALSKTDLESRCGEFRHQYGLFKANRMALNLSRGKPAADQLDLSNGLEHAIGGNFRSADGTDVRNYGGIRGIPEARELGASLLEVPAANVMVGGNSSLNLMYLAVSTARDCGLWGDARAWRKTDRPKILTPVPGYDRHFALTHALDIEMINVPMTETGPDMQRAREIAAADAAVKGIWCVPKYANPTGCTYDDATVAALAALPNDAAADDFVVLYDNAYAVHDLVFPGDALAPIFPYAERANTVEHVVQFASTSKITFAGGGVSFISSGETVLQALERQLGVMTIGPDKVNQLRHCRFLGARLGEHMRAHAALIKPKFDIVIDTLESELEPDIAAWTNPRGGYFVSLDVRPGLATRIVAMAADVGLTLTPAGATFPYGHDPQDSNIRIAPTFASVEEIKAAMQVLTLCVKLATYEQALESHDDHK